jgi:hypothetical protein
MPSAVFQGCGPSGSEPDSFVEEGKKCGGAIQEVKECAIFCMVLVISILGDQLKKELSMCLPLLTERLHHEITCLTAVKVGSFKSCLFCLWFSDCALSVMQV